MAPLDFLKKFRTLLVEDNIFVGDIEMTSGNYDDFGDLIKADIPTLTTDLCEIGIFDNSLYCVVIILSNTFGKDAFDSLKIFSNIKIYGFKDFNKILYPAPDFNYENFKKEVSNDKYLQIQFNYKYDTINEHILFEDYQKIKIFFVSSRLQVINQLNKNF